MPSTISVLQDDRNTVILGDSGQYVVKLDLVHCAGKNFMTVHYRINLRRNDALVISQSQVASSESDKESENVVSSRCQCASVLLGTSLAMGIELLKLSSMC